MQQFDNLPDAHFQTVHLTHDFPKLPNWQAHYRPQIGDQTRQPHANASLSQDLLRQFHWSFVPLVALRTPAFVHPMFRDLYRRWWWHINHFSDSDQTDPSQPQVAVGALHDPMLHDLGRRGSATRTIVLRIPFLARLLFFGCRLFLVGLHETSFRDLQLF